MLFAFTDAAGLPSGTTLAPHLTLLAPLMRDPVKPSLPEQTKRTSPRRFGTPPLTPPMRQVPAAPAIAAPVVEIADSFLPEIPRTPVPAPENAIPVVPMPASATKSVMKESGFDRLDAVPTPISREKTATVGAFESPKSASTQQASTQQATTKPVRASSFTSANVLSDVSPTNAAQRLQVASGFGDTTIEKISKARTQTVADRFAPVEILIKPKPAYPEEAREKKIEGEVLIEMEFSASGEAHVLRLVRGLGYGLDESALAAARGIRFRPATRDGLLVDSAAVVHILFQLAQ